MTQVTLEKLQDLRKKREHLVQLKADKQAAYTNAQAEFKRLNAEVQKAGYDLKELPKILKEKQAALHDAVVAYEAKLEEAEDQLSKFGNS
jgi:predicted  nucleic acid-binding Zn-ribbon protein